MRMVVIVSWESYHLPLLPLPLPILPLPHPSPLIARKCSIYIKNKGKNMRTNTFLMELPMTQ
jgi:hypothetical protein